MTGRYEAHHHPDPTFPIITNDVTTIAEGAAGILHWHESPELVYCVSGRGTVISDIDRINIKEGEIAAVNPGCLHSVYSDVKMRYHYIIADVSVFEAGALPVGEDNLILKIADEKAAEIFLKAIDEIHKKRLYYKGAAMAAIVELYTHLFRNWKQESFYSLKQGGERRVEIVKSAIAYLRRNYKKQITVDDICRYAGVSKYYLCRTFKEVTGQTLIGYMNFLRCKNAHKLISSGKCNVSESALQSGFGNLSYFSKTYKKIMGELPSSSIQYE